MGNGPSKYNDLPQGHHVYVCVGGRGCVLSVMAQVCHS